jgi:heme exporter protein A
LISPVLQTVALACERDLRLLFENLDLRLASGEMVQISGPNGSGKTSLLRLLSGLMQPTDGQVLLNGQPLNEQRTELARNLLWIGHAAGIKDLLTPEENLSWLCALHQPASRRHLAGPGNRRIARFRRCSLSHPVRWPATPCGAGPVAPGLSALWILDEPFTALDKQGVAQPKSTWLRIASAAAWSY